MELLIMKLTSLKPCVTFVNMFFFFTARSSHPTQLSPESLFCCPRLFIQYIRSWKPPKGPEETSNLSQDSLSPS